MTGGVPSIDVRRIYDAPQPGNGRRILVDRIWPRGLTRADAVIDEWCRDIAPSTELRRWYGHDPSRFDAFRDRYLSELDDPAHVDALARLRALAGARLTLLTATRDLDISHARVLADRLSSGRDQQSDRPMHR